MSLRPIFEVCARETGYDGLGRRRYAWWRQDVAKTQLRETLNEISWESRSRGWGEKNTQ